MAGVDEANRRSEIHRTAGKSRNELRSQTGVRAEFARQRVSVRNCARHWPDSGATRARCSKLAKIFGADTQVVFGGFVRASEGQATARIVEARCTNP